MHFSRLNTLLLMIFAVINIFFVYPSRAQEPSYQWSGQKDIPLLGIGALGTTASLILRAQNDALTVRQMNQLVRSDLPAIDENAIKNYSTRAQQASDVLLYTSYALPLASFLIPEARQEFGIITIMLAESILINETLTGLTKNLVNRPRPYTYNDDLSDDIRTNPNNNLSFFSGHTSYTAMFSFFSAQVLTNYIENPASKVALWTGAALLPAATGFFRYEGGKHFVTDVLVGYAVGAAVGYFIPKIHQHQRKRMDSKSSALQLDRKASMPLRLVFVF